MRRVEDMGVRAMLKRENLRVTEIVRQRKNITNTMTD